MSSPRQHTPGPWQVFTANNFTTIQGAVEDHPIRPGRATVASIGWTKSQSALSNWEANARLIASAPELLAALEELERLTVWVGGQNPVHDAIESAKRKARAAIARATGGNAS